jgi:hypothetical protein
MTDTTNATPAETLAKYRSAHRIVLQETGRYEYRCEVDGLRVLSMRDGRWRHNPDDVVRLLEAEYGGPFGAPKERAIERIVATVDRDEDDEFEFDIEGQPEFNGTFR